jgi:hypothetical protein
MLPLIAKAAALSKAVDHHEAAFGPLHFVSQSPTAVRPLAAAN